MQADSAGGVERVTSLYTDDAILIPSDKSDIIGINAYPGKLSKHFCQFYFAIEGDYQ